MAISDRTRKVLWARSGNRCARCRLHLIRVAKATGDESVVGDECHIVAQSTAGPRGGEVSPDAIDELDNLILLCKSDHKEVDDLPGIFTSDAVRRMKAEHEVWVDSVLSLAAERPALERDALEALEQRLLRVEFLQESLLPPRYLLLAVDLQRPMRPAELGHFRALLELRAFDRGDSRALYIGGRDAYPIYHFGGQETLVFGHLLLSWTEDPHQLRQSTMFSQGFVEVPQVVFESATRDLPEFSALSELPQVHASVYLTERLWEDASRVTIVASDYVMASYARSELAALTGGPTVRWPGELTDSEASIQWRTLMPKGPDYPRYEREGESPDWFPAHLYQPWLLDTSSDTPTRIRRRTA